MNFEEDASFFDHLESFRSVLLKILLVFALLLIPGWFCSRPLIDLLLKYGAPSGFRLHYFTLLEPFLVQLKMTFSLALALSIPFACYFLWNFIAPGLYPDERKWAGVCVFSASFLAIGGIAFSVFFLVPAIIGFSLSFSDSSMSPVIGIDSFVSMFLTAGVASALLFQFPLVLYGLMASGIVLPETVRRKRGVILVAILVVSAFLTPPDALSQILLATPTYLLFELTLFLFRFRKERDLSQTVYQEADKQSQKETCHEQT